jgi:hypothetical protein
MRKGFAPLPPSVKCLVGLFPFSSGAENPPEAATLVSRDDIRNGGANFAFLEPRPVARGMRRVAMACPLGCLLEPTAGPRGDVGEKATAPDSTSASIAASIAPAPVVAPLLLTRIVQQLAGVPFALGINTQGARLRGGKC